MNKSANMLYTLGAITITLSLGLADDSPAKPPITSPASVISLSDFADGILNGKFTKDSRLIISGTIKAGVSNATSKRADGETITVGGGGNSLEQQVLALMAKGRVETLGFNAFVYAKKPSGQLVQVEETAPQTLNVKFGEDQLFLAKIVWEGERIPAEFKEDAGRWNSNKELALAMLSNFVAEFRGEFEDWDDSSWSGVPGNKSVPVLHWMQANKSKAK